MHISIIVPAFKRVGQTIKTLELILQSDGWNSEYQAELIVSDCSPDFQLKRAIQKDLRDVIYLRNKKIGIASNKNRGAEKAKGEVLIFCDTDIEIEKDTFKKTIESLKKHPKAFAIGGKVMWKGGKLDGKLDRPRMEDRIKRIEGAEYIEAIYSRYFVTYAKVFKKLGGYDEIAFNMRGEGADLSTRYWRAGYPLVYDPHIKVHHIADIEHSAEGSRPGSNNNYAIAKDYFLLAYKFGMLTGSYPNFEKTIAVNVSNQTSKSSLRGLASGEDEAIFLSSWRLPRRFAPRNDGGSFAVTGDLREVKKHLDKEKKKKPLYDFKFLEVFSDPNLLKKVIRLSRRE